MTCVVLVVALCLTPCYAIREHHVVQHKTPVKRISGRVVDYTGTPLPGVEVQVFDHPEVWSDDSLSFVEKRKRQTKIAESLADDDGRFAVKRIPKGRYEAQFFRDGWDYLSVLLAVDSSVREDKMCVELKISGGPGEPRVLSCKAVAINKTR